jgi:hypothetical protein
MANPRTIKAGPKAPCLSVKMPLLPNYLQCSADEKHWMTMPVKQMHPKVLRRIGRAWTEMLVAKSKVKP